MSAELDINAKHIEFDKNKNIQWVRKSKIKMERGWNLEGFFYDIKMERSVKEIPPISADIEMFLPYSITNRTTQVLPSNGPTFVKVYR